MTAAAWLQAPAPLGRCLQPAAWASIAGRLAPGGRIMANMGAGPRMGSPMVGVNETYLALDALREVVGGEALPCWEAGRPESGARGEGGELSPAPGPVACA
jgi:hypothetical protein